MEKLTLQRDIYREIWTIEEHRHEETTLRRNIYYTQLVDNPHP